MNFRLQFTALKKPVRKFLNGLSVQIKRIRELGVKRYILFNNALMAAMLKANASKKRYNILSADQLRGTRTSDKVFVFGSGRSILDITEEEWRHFEEHDTLGFTGFIYQKWVRLDYHLIRGWVEMVEGTYRWRKYTSEYIDVLNRNPFFKDTILIMQADYSATFANRLLGYKYIKPGTRVYRYKTVRYQGLPTQSLEQGLRHAMGTLCDAVNFAYCMGYKEIVLAGVDLYDCCYFWLPPGKTETYDPESNTMVPSSINVRGIKYSDKHRTAQSGIINLMKEWNDFFISQGIRMSVYNPRSLMRQVLPLYEREFNHNQVI